MKIWWVFGNDSYYPRGGLADLLDTFESEDEALNYRELIRSGYDHTRVVDISSYLGIEHWKGSTL
jgi:hypothetical protein